MNDKVFDENMKRLYSSRLVHHYQGFTFDNVIDLFQEILDTCRIYTLKKQTVIDLWSIDKVV